MTKQRKCHDSNQFNSTVSGFSAAVEAIVNFVKIHMNKDLP